MADPLGAAGSIVGIAAFGLKFATTLQTYIEAVSDAQDRLRDIAFDVGATASALEQLHGFVGADKNEKSVVNDSGLNETVRLASKCKQVYTAIIDLIAKAIGAPRDSNGEVSLEALNLESSNATSLINKLKWPFQEPRIKRHQEELRWLKISLLFHLRLMEFAKTKMTAPTRDLNTWEKEVALQATLERLLNRKKKYAREIAAERRWDRRRRAGKRRLSTSSRRSSSSTINEIRSHSPSLRQRPPRPPRPQLSPPSPKSNDEWEVSSYSSSIEVIEDVLTHMPKKPTPKPPKADPQLQNAFMSNFATNSIPNPAIGPSNIPTIGNTEKQEMREKNSDRPGQAEPVHKPMFSSPAKGSATPSDTLINAQSSAANASASKPTVSRDIGDTTNTNAGSAKESNDPQNGIIVDDFRPISTPRSLRNPFHSLPWITGLFGGRNQLVLRDWESQELEAYFIEDSLTPSDSIIVRKLPFGHQKLTSILKRITRSWRRGDVWTQYAALTSPQREGIDRAMAEANRSSPRARTCVAITSAKSGSKGRRSHGSSGGSGVVVLFSLGMPVSPIHLKYGALYYQFPFELCRTWEGIDDLIQRVLAEGRVAYGAFGQQAQNRYQLRGANDSIILPTAWASAVHPGMTVFLSRKPDMPVPLHSVPLFGNNNTRIEVPPLPVSTPNMVNTMGDRNVGVTPKPLLRPPPVVSNAYRPAFGRSGARKKEKNGPTTPEPESNPPRPVLARFSLEYHDTSSSESDAGKARKETKTKKGRDRDRDRAWFSERFRSRHSGSPPINDVPQPRASTRAAERISESAVAGELIGFDSLTRCEPGQVVIEESEDDESGLESGMRGYEKEKDEDEEVDIIDFDEERELDKLGLGGLLGRWTNAFDAPADSEQ